ncbi:PilZ domain-containing protein [Loktanella sp. PT4BL]|jgi:hypothetical protein|uniref:PilZ domain-containing protein n=1 Tax=Loktanella sp. PT4BL TaxID=2135611 RepID=UPI000D7512C9|nr:PilZ domain-containing protein [Loktanella sp. PT4BL]PXW69207.1 PilZ domain-containing protein [Loktanella sp. PT4BL]
MQYRPHRYPTQFPVRLSTPSGPVECTVLDVNTTGARLASAGQLTRGEKVTFQVLNHKAVAIVRWVSGTRAGITFRPHLTDLQVDTLRYRRDKGNYHQHRAGGLHYREMR